MDIPDLSFTELDSDSDSDAENGTDGTGPSGSDDEVEAADSGEAPAAGGSVEVHVPRRSSRARIQSDRLVYQNLGGADQTPLWQLQLIQRLHQWWTWTLSGFRRQSNKLVTVQSQRHIWKPWIQN